MICRIETRLLSLAIVAVCCLNSAAANDWMTMPSTYSHDPISGRRVTQYSQIGPVYAPQRDDYVMSGFRYYQSNIRGINGAPDNLHMVEEWGRPVRPYGEWQYPYRPYSVPYQQWGPPYGGLGWPGIAAPFNGGGP